MARQFSKRQKRAMYLVQNGECAICGKPLSEGWHADHVIAYSKDGETDVINGQALCAKCNRKKGNK